MYASIFLLLGASLAAMLTVTHISDRMRSATSKITSATASSCPPSERIAFTKTQWPTIEDPDPTIPFRNAEIYLMNADGTEPVRLTTDGFFDGMPSISPDGRGKIVFDSNRIAVLLGARIDTTNSDLFLINHDGTTDTDLNPTPLIRGSSATWSHDGKRIAFHRSSSGEYGIRIPGRAELGGPTRDSDIFVVNLDDLIEHGEQPTNLTDNFELNAPIGVKSSEDDADWSRDGLTIAFTSRNSQCDAGLPQVPAAPRIAACQAAAEIWKMNADGTNPERLTFNTLEERSPSWSPDGTKIAFMCRRSAGTPFEICVMNADGTGREFLTNNNVPDLTVDWSPDGTQIVFFRGSGADQNFFVMNYLPDENGSRHEIQLTTPPDIHLFQNWGTVAVGCGGGK